MEIIEGLRKRKIRKYSDDNNCMIDESSYEDNNGQHKEEFSFHYINGLNLSQATGFYSKLFLDLTGRPKNSKESCKYLDYFFRRGKMPSNVHVEESYRRKLGLTKVICIDELDYLHTKDQSVLYNVFDWPHLQKSNLLIIGIANTLDLSAQLMPRISSRMGSIRLTFKPYNSGQIKQIIEQRLECCPIFERSAMEYISKKVAAVSSDIRKTLNICRQAIEDYKSTLTVKELESQEEVTPIKIAHIAATFNRVYMSPIISYVSHLAHPNKLLLLSIYMELRSKSVKAVKVLNIYDRFLNLWSIFEDNSLPSYESYTYSETSAMLDIFSMVGIINTRGNPSTGDRELILLTNLDDVAFALKDFDPFFKIADGVDMAEQTKTPIVERI